MSATLEARKNTQATMLTAGFAGLMILLMFLLKWKLPVFEKIADTVTIEVELNLPEEPPTVVSGGGGGGGNDVQAPGPAGMANPTPPAPGVDEDSKDIETDDNDKTAPAVVKPTNPKPVDKVVENTSTAKTPPKIIETPVPPKPKTLYPGNTNRGAATGGNESTTYQRNGGAGGGNGVGNGNGNDGGTGGGNGGGNGTGSGTGNGPKRISGSRFVSNPKPMNAGENIAGKILAEIRVSSDGTGTFLRGKGGSLMNDPQAINIVRDWLRRNRFNAAGEESNVVYEFNIKLGG